LPEPSPEEQEEAEDRTSPLIAVVGRPNAGKSTLLNRILDDDRLVVSETPGTTRDAIEVELVKGGRRFRFIDTAGVRRKVGHGDELEKESASVAHNALARANVVVVLFDATEPAVEQDSPSRSWSPPTRPTC
jgi:GTP-binding protein